MHLARPYWNRHERTQQTIKGSWISTGTVHQTATVLLRFEWPGRDMLKVSGFG